MPWFLVNKLKRLTQESFKSPTSVRFVSARYSDVDKSSLRFHILIWKKKKKKTSTHMYSLQLNWAALSHAFIIRTKKLIIF